MSLDLIINGRRAEVSRSTPIALTYVMNDLAELRNIQSNRSNRFKLPMTRRNREIFELSEELSSETLIPYRRLDVIVIQDGVQIVPEGSLELTMSQSEYLAVVLSGNAGFFDRIKDKRLVDLDLSEFSHVWDFQRIVDSRIHDSSDGYIYSVINYGNLDDTNVVDTRLQFPAMFAKALVDKIMEETGFSVSGNILTKLISPPGTNNAVRVNIWENLILPFTNDTFTHADIFKTSRLFRAGLSSDINAITPTDPLEAIIGVVIPLNDDSSTGLFDNGDHYSTSTFVYTIDEVSSQKFFLDVLVETTVFDDVLVNIRITKNRIDGVSGGDTLATQNFLVNIIEGEKLFQIEADFTDFQIGDRITATINVLRGFLGANPNPIPVTSGFFVRQSGTFFFNDVSTDVLVGSTIDPARHLPDMTQTQFMKGVFQMLGIMPQASSIDKTIPLIRLEDIYDNQDKALNWSDKMDASQRPAVGYSIGNYAQVNKLKYSEDNLDANFASGDILIDD